MEIKFDSNEELYFSWYLDVLLENNLINSWERVTNCVTLCDKKTFLFNGKDNHLIRELTYTPDFKIVWNKNAENILYINESSVKTKVKYSDIPFKVYGDTSYIDVKGEYTHKNRVTDISFPIIQKILLEYHNMYVQKIRPLSLMDMTFHTNRYIDEMKYKIKSKLGENKIKNITIFDNWYNKDKKV